MKTTCATLDIKMHQNVKSFPLSLPCDSTADEVSFEWSYHKTSSTDLKGRIAFIVHVNVSIPDSGSERVIK